jgi:hypothetical protein
MLDLAPGMLGLVVTIQGFPPLDQQCAVPKLEVHLGKVCFI